MEKLKNASPNKRSFKKRFLSKNASNIKFIRGIISPRWDKLTTKTTGSFKYIVDLRLLLIYTISSGDYENERTRYLTFLITFLLPVKDRFANRRRL